MNNSIEKLIPDYINGHLNRADTARVEAAIESDPSLKQAVAFERRVQSAMLQPLAAPQRVPQFAKLEARLDRPAWLPKLAWPAIGTVAAALLITFSMQPILQRESGPLAPAYETLTDPAGQVAPGMLRLIAVEDLGASDLDRLLVAYELTLVKQYDGLRTWDLRVSDPAKLDAVVSALAEDQRLVVKRLDRVQ